MKFKLIVAYTKKLGIGYKGGLPWNTITYKNDMKRFVRLTIGNHNNAIIMGRNTWKSLPFQYLRHRDNLILTTKFNIEKNYDNRNIIKTFNNVDDIYKYCLNKNYDNVWIIGGSTIYETMLNRDMIDECYITRIHDNHDCDSFFKHELDKMDEWKILHREYIEKDKIEYIKYIKCINYL